MYMQEKDTHRQTTSQREADRHMYVYARERHRQTDNKSKRGRQTNACMYAHSMIDMLVYANKQQHQTREKTGNTHT